MTAKNREELRLQLKVNSFVLKNLARFYNDGYRRIGHTAFCGDHWEITMKHRLNGREIVIMYSENMSCASVFLGDKLIDHYKPCQAVPQSNDASISIG